MADVLEISGPRQKASDVVACENELPRIVIVGGGSLGWRPREHCGDAMPKSFLSIDEIITSSSLCSTRQRPPFSRRRKSPRQFGNSPRSKRTFP